MTRALRHITREHNPFVRTGVSIDTDGSARYTALPPSLIAMLERHVDQTPDAEAVVELGGGRLTYRQLWERAARVAGGLREAGIGRGDRVAVRYGGGIDWVLAFWGTVFAGAIAVAPNTRSAPPEIEFVLHDAGVRLDLAPGVAVPDAAPYVTEGLGPRDLAAMFYTSGTTGNPKGVPTTHEAFLTNAENVVRVLDLPPGIGEDLRTLISVPLFHVTGCNSQLLTALYLGGTAVIMPEFDQLALLRALGSERISLMVSVPAIYALLLRNPQFALADLRSVRWVGYGGAAIAPDLVAALKRAFPATRVFNGYGMTETAALLAALPDTDAVEHADSVGYAVPTVDLAILPIGEDPDVGELVSRGANIMTGYWHRPEETDAALADGWLHTGDIVRVDAAGRIHLIDRVKDIIIRGGENVSSLEVEAVLAGAPTILEAAVLAVPDDVMGEKVGAVVYSGDESVDVEAVLAYCGHHLAEFKIPQYIQLSATPLPRNAGGKLLKGKLREGAVWGEPLR